jgi:hypothetical protein
VTNVAAQISAFAAVKVLTEGLRRSGRDLSREKFIASLDGLFEVDTGLTRPLTYSKNRRIGALGAYIVTVDPDRQGEDGFLFEEVDSLALMLGPEGS